MYYNLLCIYIYISLPKLFCYDDKKLCCGNKSQVYNKTNFVTITQFFCVIAMECIVFIQQQINVVWQTLGQHTPINTLQSTYIHLHV